MSLCIICRIQECGNLHVPAGIIFVVWIAQQQHCLMRRCFRQGKVSLHGPCWIAAAKCQNNTNTSVKNPYQNSRNHCTLSVFGECGGAVGHLNTSMLLQHKLSATDRRHDTKKTATHCVKDKGLLDAHAALLAPLKILLGTLVRQPPKAYRRVP